MKNIINKLIKTYIVKLTIYLILGLVVTSISFIIPIITSKITDSLVEKNFNNSLYFLLIFSITFMFSIVIKYISEKFKLNLELYFEYGLQKNIFKGFVESSSSKSTIKNLTESSQNVLTDCIEITKFILEDVFTFVFNISVLLGSMGIYFL